MRFLPACFALLTCTTLSLQAADDADELAGAWRLISSNGQRDALADDLDQSTLLSFNPEDTTWKLASQSADSGGLNFDGTYTIDPTQTPKLLDATINGDGGATMIYGIYKIEGDEVTIHFRSDGQRPGDFDSPIDASSTLVFKKHVPQ